MPTFAKKGFVHKSAKELTPTIRSVNNAINWIIIYPVDSAARILNTYLMVSDTLIRCIALSTL